MEGYNFFMVTQNVMMELKCLFMMVLVEQLNCFIGNLHSSREKKSTNFIFDMHCKQDGKGTKKGSLSFTD